MILISFDQNDYNSHFFLEDDFGENIQPGGSFDSVFKTAIPVHNFVIGVY